MTIGQLIRHCRARRGITIRELAAKSGIQYSIVHAIETSPKRMGHWWTIQRLFAAMDIDILAMLLAEINRGAKPTLTDRRHAAEVGDA